MIDLHGVIDDQLRGRERIDGGRSSPQGDDGIAHSGQVNHRRHAREVLQNHPRRCECDLGFWFRFRIPCSQCPDVVAGNVDAVFVAQEILQENFQRVGELVYAIVAHGIQTKDLILSPPDRERLAGAKGICHEWFLEFIAGNSGARIITGGLKACCR